MPVVCWRLAIRLHHGNDARQSFQQAMEHPRDGQTDAGTARRQQRDVAAELQRVAEPAFVRQQHGAPCQLGQRGERRQ
ncbi:MAG TPA: hypothetical protein VFE41_16510 [Acetobacteraceae bacterium]|nr:hypothetical protein [Acetobacteraceae bacterium]